MKTSATIKEITSALIAMQSELEPIAKDMSANMGNRMQKYASLNAVMEYLRPIMKKHGIAIVQVPASESGATLTTTLIHTSGEFISGTVTVPMQRQNDPQAFGSALTYGRRYSILAMLGLTTEDDDAASARMGMEDIVKKIFQITNAEDLRAYYIKELSGLRGDEKRAIHMIVKQYGTDLKAAGKQYEEQAI